MTAKYKHHSIKLEARQETIFRFQKLSGYTRLPANWFYWTLAADQTHEESEVKQLVDTGFLKPEQFIGIDWDEEKQYLNAQAHEHSTWITGDFADIICRPSVQPSLQNALVYLDTVNTPPNAWSLLELATRVVQKGVIIHNVVTWNRSGFHDINEFAPRMPEGWHLVPDFDFTYRYLQTQMTTLYLTKGIQNVNSSK